MVLSLWIVILIQGLIIQENHLLIVMDNNFMVEMLISTSFPCLSNNNIGNIARLLDSIALNHF